MKEDIAKMLNQSMLYCGKQNELMQELQRDVAVMKTELVSAQRRIIQLQDLNYWLVKMCSSSLCRRL